jgi:hypothetical protein
MSYKSTVLSDYPLAYYPLDDMTTIDSVLDFNDMLSQFDTYQEVLDAFSSYSNIYGDIAYDHSGCENDSVYIGDPESNLLPVVVGNSRSTKISNLNSIRYTIDRNYTAKQTNSQFGTAYSSDNDFTIEFWFYPQISNDDLTPLVGDSTNDVGVFYENGNIVFKVDLQTLEYTLDNTKKAFYIVATYTQSTISIYIDGELAVNKNLSAFKFTNTALALYSGPCLNSSDSFLINSVGIYRYALSANQIAYHYQASKGLSPLEIASPDNGEVFQIFDDSISSVFQYSYPADKPWSNFVTTGIYYNQIEDVIEIEKSTGSKTVILEDYIILPSLTADSSKIEWSGDNGILVETSIDDSTYVQCVNGQSIPQYKLGSFSSTNKLYIKITMSTTDASKYLPKLKYFSISLYNNQRVFASNGPSNITTMDGVTGVSDSNISFGLNKSDILLRDNRNGLRTVVDSSFYLNTDTLVKTLEFFYTPSSLGTSSLVSSKANGGAASNFSWNSIGAISKTNISAIYVNGINKTSQTNISNVFKDDQLHHVVIVYSQAISGEIEFNHNLSGSVSALYQYIALYPDAFNSTKALDHYSLWINKDVETINDNSTYSLKIDQDEAEYFDNVWLLVQNA